MRLAECREDGQMYAIKIIDKKALKGKEDSLENEIRVLKRYFTRDSLYSLHIVYYLSGWTIVTL